MEKMAPHDLAALPWLFEFWAMPHQLPPEGDWRTWVILGGRGAGKTRAGAEWIRSQVEGALPGDPGKVKHVALVGETIEQAREVMVFGESGILTCSPPDRCPEWQSVRKRLVWPNGAVAQVFGAHDAERLRGPQFDCAWVDELAKWRQPDAAFDMLQFALRLGEHPQQVVTTTPRDVELLKRLLKRESTVMTSAPTTANKAHLATSFLEEVQARYGGTRLGRQELDGHLVEDADGALWSTGMLDRAQVVQAPEDLDRIVVAVDPAVSGKAKSDLCGIVVAGLRAKGPVADWRAWVMQDASVKATSPIAWAKAAVAAFHRHGADRIVAEVNQGGDLVEQVLRQVDPLVPVQKVSATRGKALRAEPVAALYEQGRVSHVSTLRDLEDQMTRMTVRGYEGRGSPDRLDALVWALTDLMIDPAAASTQRPQIRGL